MENFKFKIIQPNRKIKARIGVILTPHGKIQTPAFVPVGTQATVKSLTPEELNNLGVQLFFVNTYHAYLRPGLDVIKKFGGLHRFMGWNGPLITDSGGFQVFSLGRGRGGLGDAFFEDVRRPKSTTYSLPPSSLNEAQPLTVGRTLWDKKRLGFSASQNDHPSRLLDNVKITEEGVEFRSHWDGSEHLFSPEKSIEIQHILGADMILAFDECAPYPTTHQYAKKAMERTHRWAVRSLEAHLQYQISKIKYQKYISKIKNDKYQALYGVIQGSVYEDLRKESAKFISSLPFDGIAIGGVSVGESKEEMRKVLEWVTPLLPSDKPRHLLGVGEIDDIFTLVEHGIDTFDCVQPTRLARMGKLYTRSKIKDQRSKIKIKNQKLEYEIDIMKANYRHDTSSVDLTCQCYTCQYFSRAYLHHLFRVRELLAYRLATIHNIYFVNNLMRQIRQAISQGTFLELKKGWLYNRA